MEEQQQPEPKWGPLETNDRRVLGVLVEKAKTTPDAYPLSLNALRTGCNQKSNRFPQLDLDEDRVEDAIERLRKVGGVTIVQGDSRVQRYRHLAYEWLGVDKTELAVMAELLLRGAQTIGELRGRAARMESIPGMTELRPVLASLVEKNLVLYLTPPGRGAVVTHNLYLPQQLEKVRREHGSGEPIAPPPASTASSSTAPSSTAPPATAPAAPPPAAVPSSPPPAPSAAPSAAPPAAPPAAVVPSDDSLKQEITTLRAEIRETVASMSANIERLQTEVDDLKQQLGV